MRHDGRDYLTFQFNGIEPFFKIIVTEQLHHPQLYALLVA